MNLWLPILVLSLATAFGLWWRKNQGEMRKSKNSKNSISKAELGLDLGSRVTIVQFSSAFCSPCRATNLIITELVKDMKDVVYSQIKAEENLQLIEKFDIKSTPTVIFFNGQGNEVGRAMGTPTNQQVLAAIASVR